MVSRIGLGVLAPLMMLATGVMAKPALRDVAEVREGLIAVGIAYEVSQQCPSVDARLFRGIAYLNGLKSQARQLGYSSEEIDAYTDDKAEQDHLETLARQRLSQMGAVEGQPETYCAVGRREIAQGSAIGRLLR